MKKYFKHIITPVIFIFMSLTVSSSLYGYDLEKIKANLPKMLGASNVGSEFWLTVPPCFENPGTSDQNSVIIYVSSLNKASVTVEVPGKTYKETKETIPNDVIYFTLSPEQALPWTKNEAESSPEEAILEGNGIHIYSDDLIVVYVHIAFGARTDCFMALPVSSLGTNYMVSSYTTSSNSGGTSMLPSLTGCVAAYDNTTVHFTVGGTTGTTTMKGYKTGETQTVTLNKGDVFMVAADALGHDLTGSKWVAGKPVAVVSGNYCALVPSGNTSCDYLAEMDLPTFTWGKNYHVAKIQNRTYAPVIRVFAKEAGTQIYRDSVAVASLTDAGGLINKGWLDMRLSSMSSTPASALITGSNPIAVTLYNTGNQEDGSANQSTNPFESVCISQEQYQNECSFIVPGIIGSTSLTNHTLNLVYETDSVGNVPESLELGRVISGNLAWEQVSKAYMSTDEKYPVNLKGKTYAVKNIALQNKGLVKVKGDKLFSAYVNGSGSGSAYGQPGAMGLKDLTKNDTLPPVPVWTFKFDRTTSASVTDKPSDVNSRSNLSMIYFHPDSSYNFSFTCGDIVPGTTSQANWSLQVKDIGQDALAVITFCDRSGNDTTIAVEYEALNYSADVANLDFGYLKKGVDSVKTFTIKNTKTKGKIDFTRAGFKQSSPGLSFSSLEFPFTLLAGEERAVSVKFSPVKTGEVIDSAGLGDINRILYKVRILATVKEPSISALDVNFGSIKAGTTSTKDCIIKNSGLVDLVISSVQNPSNPAFTHNLTSLPLTLKAGASITVQVGFSPASEGTYKDSIVLVSDSDSLSDNVVVLEGKGMLAGLEANSYDWGRVRIDREKFPRGPYGNDWVPGQEKAVLMKNTGTQSVTITGIDISTIKGDKAAFIIPGTAFSRTINPGESFLVDVQFQPKTVGEHEIRITFTSNTESPVSTLRGIGVLPRVHMDSVDFGASTVNEPSTKQTRKVKVYNEYYDWADTLFITGFTCDPLGSIAETPGVYGTEGFNFDKAGIFSGASQIIIPINASVELDAEYLAQHKGVNRATIKTVSDAEADVYSLWTGNIADPVEDDTPLSNGLLVIPNPAANGSVSLRIAAVTDCQATIRVFNSLGFEACSPFSGSLQQGVNSLSLAMGSLPSGVYYIAVNTGNKVDRVKFTYIR